LPEVDNRVRQDWRVRQALLVQRDHREPRALAYKVLPAQQDQLAQLAPPVLKELLGRVYKVLPALPVRRDQQAQQDHRVQLVLAYKALLALLVRRDPREPLARRDPLVRRALRERRASKARQVLRHSSMIAIGGAVHLT
jgi:hypothetical protein